MRVLVCNPPWYAQGGWGLRAGADPPRLVPTGSREVPWPARLAYASAFLAAHDVATSLVDSIATRESVEGFLHRVGDLLVDVVAVATSPASLVDDLPLLLEVGQLRPLVVLWPGTREEARGLLELPGLRAIACGEYERGLLAAAMLDDLTIYPSDPLTALDELPAPYRDSVVHRYRYPLPGLPEGPQLAIEVSRGADRWRSLGAITDELAACRRDWPRLTQVFLTDRDVNANPERFAELAEALAGQDWPWAARVNAAHPLPEAAGRAAALEVRLEALPEVAPLRALARGGATLTLAPELSLREQAAELERLAVELGATLSWRPESEPTAQAALAQAATWVQARATPRRRLYIVGSHVPQYMPPWLMAGADEAGWEGVAVDVFADPRAVLKLYESRPEDIVFLDRGIGVPAEALAQVAGRKVLYYPDVLPTLAGAEPIAYVKYREVLALCHAVDDLVLHDGHGLPWLREQGHDNVRGVLMLPYAPWRHRDLQLDRDLDVVFLGVGSDHRTQWIEQIRADGVDVQWLEAWGDDYIGLLNRTKIVLNLHYTSFPNTELRILEALACGAFVVSEPLTEPPLFTDGEHFVTTDLDHAADTLRRYLALPEERARMVAAGQAYIAERFTARHFVDGLLALLEGGAA